jgi:protein TonB
MQPKAPARASSRPLQASDDFCDLNGTRGGIDSYKVSVANHIARSNLGNTFEGRLPPILPAVVVLRITVDSLGRIVDAYVQRSRNDAASKIALASLQRAGSFPSPCSLINDQSPLLSFSETFLFNDQYQFQLRSIAGPQ